MGVPPGVRDLIISTQVGDVYAAVLTAPYVSASRADAVDVTAMGE